MLPEKVESFLINILHDTIINPVNQPNQNLFCLCHLLLTFIFLVIYNMFTWGKTKEFTVFWLRTTPFIQQCGLSLGQQTKTNSVSLSQSHSLATCNCANSEAGKTLHFIDFYYIRKNIYNQPKLQAAHFTDWRNKNQFFQHGK